MTDLPDDEHEQHACGELYGGVEDESDLERAIAADHVGRERVITSMSSQYTVKPVNRLFHAVT